MFQMFHGVIVSASQVLAVESVFTGAVVYLACLLYSPITAGFAVLGALVGSLAGIILFLCMSLEFIERKIESMYLVNVFFFFFF